MGKARTIIVGAGGFGRELINWAGACCEAGLLPALGGLIDDDPQALDGFDYTVGWLGTLSDFTPMAEDHLLMAIGDPAAKKRIATMLADRGGRFVSLIHPTAIIAQSSRIAEGAILCPLSLVSADAELGRLCTVNALSSIGHDVRIGDYTTLSAHVDLTGSVSVENEVMIGSGARVLPGVKIGKGATVGAGAVVYRNVIGGRSVFAPPAKALNISQSKESTSR